MGYFTVISLLIQVPYGYGIVDKCEYGMVRSVYEIEELLQQHNLLVAGGMEAPAQWGKPNTIRSKICGQLAKVLFLKDSLTKLRVIRRQGITNSDDQP